MRLSWGAIVLCSWGDSWVWGAAIEGVRYVSQLNGANLASRGKEGAKITFHCDCALYDCMWQMNLIDWLKKGKKKLWFAATKVVGDHQNWWITSLESYLGGVGDAFRGVSGQKSLPPAAVCPRGIPAPCHSHCPPPRCPHGHCPSGWTCPCLVMHTWGEDLENITKTYRYQSVRNTVSEKQCSCSANSKLYAFCFAGW